MDKTPKNTKYSCLTLNKKRLSDSRKSSFKIIESPDCFITSSPTSSQYNREYYNNSPCSTPIAKKILSYHFEESPSQDHDNYVILQSQDVKSNILDVGWKWDESPKAAAVSTNIKQDKLKSSSTKIIKDKKRTSIKSGVSKLIKRQIENEKNDERHGFYRFKEELLKIKSSENCQQQNCDELCSSLKENENHNIENDIDMDVKLVLSNHIEDIKIVDTNSVKNINKRNEVTENLVLNGNEEGGVGDNEKYKNLFDDSDTDNLLIELSQQAEAQIEPKMKNDFNHQTTNENKNQINSIQNDIEVDDSFDDVLLSLRLPPVTIDKNLENQQNENNNLQCDIKKFTSNDILKKNNFTRYNSMPVVSPQIRKNPPVKIATKTFVRHNSMPENKIDTIIPVKSNNIVPSTSNYCGPSNKNFSNSKEIERRKQEAKQRLMLTMQKRLQKPPSSQTHINKNHIKNSYQNAKM